LRAISHVAIVPCAACVYVRVVTRLHADREIVVAIGEAAYCPAGGRQVGRFRAEERRAGTPRTARHDFFVGTHTARSSSIVNFDPMPTIITFVLVS